MTNYTNANLNWRMPAEWEPHEATWVAWPHHGADWPGKFAPIPWVYAEIVRHLHRSEVVRILVKDRAARRQAAARLQAAGIDLQRVEFFIIPTDRSWVRDSGPIFVVSTTPKRHEVGLTHWRFTGWAKYDNVQRDRKVPPRIARALGLPLVVVRDDAGQQVVLEGGSIDVNGAGLLVTTEECLLSKVQERNPGLGRADYEQLFARFLGVRKVVWLGRGIAGDDTHGHVDDVARFIGPGVLAAVVEDDRGDDNYEALKDNLERLRRATTVEGKPLTIVPLPMPEPVWFRGQRLPASYANFYIANRHVLVPTFNDPHDAEALATLAGVFPGRTVVGIHAVDLVWGLGTLHCLTQQQPRGAL